MHELIAVVPARGGSKGLPGKNLKPLAGVPLWRRAADQGLDAGASRVIVTTDIAEIIGGMYAGQIEVVARPDDLAGDAVPMAPVLMHALADQRYAGATVVLLQPTSPLRSVEDIRGAVALYGEGGADLVMSVTEADRGVLKYGTIENGMFQPMREAAHCFSNRQALPEVWRPNGAVYVFARDWFLQNVGFESERIKAWPMPIERSADIDSEADFARAEALLV